MNGEPYTPVEIDAVLERYEGTPTRRLAEELGVTTGRLWRLARILDVPKSAKCIAEQSRQAMLRPDHGGRKCTFPKGHTPANKGTRRPGFAAGRMRETQFKKGQQPVGTMPIGATRLIDGYLYRKVSDIPKVPCSVNWKPEHILRWEKRRGAIPAGHALVFRDGDRSRIRISNLELITRAELCVRNSIHNLPKDLVHVIMLNGALKRKIRNREKRHAEE